MNIKCTQNIYKSANGVSNVAYYILVPEDSHIRGIVQISHGMCEYFSRYTAFAKYLCGLGFIVCGNDHIGHGASVSRPADLGFFAAHDGWKYLIQDVLHLRELMHRRYPDLPYFMLGHSMGSLIVRLCLSECGTELAGAILIGTAGPNAAALSAAHVADSIARTRGVTFRSGLLNSIAFKERFEEGFRRLLVPVLKENGDREATLDTFFLLSVEEMKDKEKKYQRFRSERDCVKDNPEQETEWHWTRSASRGTAYYTWYVSASGYVYNSHAVNSFRFAPACVIGAKAIK